MIRHGARGYAPALWMLAMVVALIWLADNWRLETGIAAFLPRDQGVASTLLQREARGAGPAGAILAILSGRTDGADSIAAVTASLRNDPRYALIATGTADLAGAAQALFPYRYLLDPATASGAAFSKRGLRASLETLVSRLRDPAGLANPVRLAADPTGAWQRVLRQWFTDAPGEGGVGWRLDQGKRLLLALPRAGAYALDAQAEAVAGVREAARAAGWRAKLAGAPAIAVATRKTVRAEAGQVSIWAGVGVLLILVLGLRPRRCALLSLLPVTSAVVAGLVSVLAVFGSLHGIALAFGATLLGLTADYPVHLFGHGGDAAAAHSIRRPLVLGLVSTVLGFSALALAGLEGLTQIAVFAMAGLVAAGLTTLIVLPGAGVHCSAVSGWVMGLTGWRPRPLVGGCLVAGVMTLAGFSLPQLSLGSDLAALSPVPEALRARDAHVRAALGLVGARHLLVAEAPTQEAALRATEQVVASLDRHHVSRYQTVTRLLPSRARQQRRQAKLPPRDMLRRRLTAAAEGLPLRVPALTAFVDAVARSRTLAPLTLARLADEPVATWLSGLLFQAHGHWLSLIRLDKPLAPTTLAAVHEAAEGAGVTIASVDLKAAVNRAVAHYQHQIVVYSLVGSVGIVALLLFGLPGWRARLRSVLVMLCGLGGSLVWLAVAGATLSLFHLASLLLVAGLGLDYGLFNGGSRRGAATTTVCALSTVVAFVALASASTPVLHDIGTTVVAGAITAWLVASSLPKDVE